MSNDAANGIHRVSLDEATVERAARALFLVDNPEAVWDRFTEHTYIKDRYRTTARAVLAAAVEVDNV